MRRVVVIGSGGAGKSTFSKMLGDATGLEVIHLDSIYWRPNWQKTPPDEWETTVRRLSEQEAWIMDGNFGGTREIRIAASDTVVLLDIPRYLCLARVIRRAMRYRGRSRPDMAAGCNEKIDLEFLAWIWNYPRQGRRRLFTQMERHPNKRFVVLRSRRQIQDFLRNAERSSTHGRDGNQA